ncbi:MAG: hypothetical protein HRT89_04665 [Lentisphaeria bacterium]|nr:hypothetical protein [Lentisphaeria bacterium]NQZ67340.1 hypothetical protein [Lentisphaeria bacterium]
MARVLAFQIDNTELSCELNKVERKKLYGWVDKKAYDRDGNPCYLGSLSKDGLYIFGKQSFDAGFVSDDGDWVEKTELQAYSVDNKEIQKVEASFKGIVDVSETVSIDEFLMYNIRSLYELSGDNSTVLLEKVKAADGIYKLSFNYVASYFPDTAFLIENDDSLYMLIGKQSNFNFVARDDAADLNETDEESEEEDDFMDFGMI